MLVLCGSDDSGVGGVGGVGAGDGVVPVCPVGACDGVGGGRGVSDWDD